MSTFIAELVALAIILFVIARYVMPRILGPLQKRQALIFKQVEEAEQARARLAEAERAFQNALTESRTESAQIRENARAEAQRTVEDLRRQAHEESARIVTRGEEQLASQRASVVRDLRSEIGALAVELAETIVTKRLADEAQVSASVDAFLAGLASRDDSADGPGGTAGGNSAGGTPTRTSTAVDPTSGGTPA